MNRLPIIPMVATIVCSTSLLSAQITAPNKLDWRTIDEVEKYIRLKPADENYQKIVWHSTVIAGQQLAQKEDKPLLLWLYFGDPRGNC